MTQYNLRNILIEKIKDSDSLTDVELLKSVQKDGHVFSLGKFNKVLLDLEILGAIKVAWITKDKRRIEIVKEVEEEDEIEIQNREAMERDYESSFPGNEP